MSYRLVILCTILLVSSTVSAQVVRRRNATWVSLARDVTYRLTGYEVSERIEPRDNKSAKCAYFKRDGDKEPHLFYIHNRQIVVTLGHRKRHVLINDWDATKSAKVVVANLRSGESRQIDLPAVKMYHRHAAPDRRLWIVPEAYEFSPDESQVLIKMVSEDVSAATIEESARATKTYREWWYVVSSRNGQVVHEYRKKRVPHRWWS